MIPIPHTLDDTIVFANGDQIIRINKVAFSEDVSLKAVTDFVVLTIIEMLEENLGTN